MTDYRSQARVHARSMAENYIDELVEQLTDDGEASDDLFNDYSNGDGYHHENHVDQAYDLEEAASILAQLREHKETDKGLWQGLEPEDALSAQAAYTFGNAVLHYWSAVIQSINDEALTGVLADALLDYEGGEVPLDTVKGIVLAVIADS